MRLQSACYILGAALCLTAPAWAQSTAITPTGTGTQTTSSTSTGAFQNLSPGGQKIAQSLFDAQHPPTGTKAMTLDQIAALKGKEGWGRVFKEMKSDGLVQARNLGQVVSGHAKTTQTTSSTGTTSSTQTTSAARTGGSRHVSTRTTSSRTPVVVTSGSGRSTVFASNAGRGGHGRFASNSSSHFTTAGGPSGNGGGFGGGGHGGGGSSHGGGHGGK
jgi:hypothetical protein